MQHILLRLNTAKFEKMTYSCWGHKNSGEQRPQTNDKRTIHDRQEKISGYSKFCGWTIGRISRAIFGYKICG